jgi:hypothetical protein
MRKLLRFISKTIAIVFALLFIIAALPTPPLFSAGWQLFSPYLYRRALVEADIYTRFPELVSEQLVHSMAYNPCAENPDSAACQAEGKAGDSSEEDGPPSFIEHITQEDYEAIITKLVPPEWLQAQAESIIGQIFAYIDSDEPRPMLAISLTQIKERISGEEELQAVMQIVRAQPKCTPEQMAVIESDDVSADEIPLCQPPQEKIDEYTHDVEMVLDEVARDIPNSAVVDLSSLSADAQEGPFGDSPSLTLRIIRSALRLSPLVPVTLLLLVTLFGVRSWKEWGQWWGIPILIIGAIWASLAVVALPSFDLILKPFLAVNAPPEVTWSLLEAGLDVVRHIVYALATGIGVQAGILTSLGLLLLAISFLLKRKRTEYGLPDTED